MKNKTIITSIIIILITLTITTLFAQAPPPPPPPPPPPGVPFGAVEFLLGALGVYAYKKFKPSEKE